LPSLGHTTYSHLKGAYFTASKGLVDSGADALLIETLKIYCRLKLPSMALDKRSLNLNVT
jgi:methionine synthase I (cobalamin-dependent)